MTYPATDVNTTNTDVTGDSPVLARADIFDLMTKFNLLRNHISGLGQTLLNRATAVLMRNDLGAAASGANGDIASLTALASVNGGPLAGLRNRVMNGNFGINQRAVSGTVTLAAGSYGHDRFRAGAGGCTYTFSTALNVTTLTISAGTLQQVIEGTNLQSGAHKLSWAGTAQGRVDSGSYGATGVVGTAVGGVNQTVEFNTGTLGLVQYEPGSVATVFEQRPIGLELSLCQRYYQLSAVSYQGYISSSNFLVLGALQPMRATPTLTVVTAPSLTNCTGFVVGSPTYQQTTSFFYGATASSAGMTGAANGLVSASSEL